MDHDWPATPPGPPGGTDDPATVGLLALWLGVAGPAEDVPGLSHPERPAVTLDTSGLERTCIMFNCDRPAVDPNRGQVHCAAHTPADKPGIAPAPAPAREPAREPVVERPDPTELEPHWDGQQWVLRPKQDPPTLACPHCGGRLEVQIR